MADYLQIEWHPDDDWNDVIHVRMVSSGFSATGGPYYVHRVALAEFGEDLDRYPIEPATVPELSIRYGRLVGTPPETVVDLPPVLRIRIEAVDRTGHLVAAALITDSESDQRAELRMETGYGALQRFREQLRKAEGPPMDGVARLE